MNKESPEYERVKKQVAYTVGVKLSHRCGTELCTQFDFCEQCLAFQILSIKGIRIEADDQSLPDNPYLPSLDETQGIWSDIVVATQQDMLKAKFRKVI